MGRLEGKTAVITGARRGIGLATMRRFEAEGARVIAINRPNGIPPTHPQAVIHADVRDHSGLTAALNQAHEKLGGIDVCVANAGTMLLEDLLDGTPEHWEAVLAVNLIGAMTTFQAAAAHMVADRRGGRLLATSSIAGLRGEAGSAVYCASKAGVFGLVQSLAVELAPHDITVNAVAPGEIDTDMHASVMQQIADRENDAPDHVRSTLIQERIPAQRMGTPADIAGLFLFLASDDAAYVTGETFRVDGGQLLI